MGFKPQDSTGTVIAVYWKLVDDSQTANWQNITDSQTPGWTLIGIVGTYYTETTVLSADTANDGFIVIIEGVSVSLVSTYILKITTDNNSLSSWVEIATVP
jgi:uncharacterized protein YdeI (BOF family)